MVGGFSTSDYLFSQLENHFKTKGISVLRPDAYLSVFVLCLNFTMTTDNSHIEAKQSQRVPLCSHSIILCLVESLSTHMGLKVALLTIQNLRTIVHASALASRHALESL